MKTLYCIHCEKEVVAQKGNPSEFVHEVWTPTFNINFEHPEIDWCEFPDGWATTPPPESLFSDDLDRGDSTMWAMWSEEYEPDADEMVAINTNAEIY